MDLEFVEKALPAVTLSQLTGHVADPADVGPRVGPLFEELVDKLLAAGRQPGHPGYAWYSGRDGGLDIGAGFAVADVPGTEVGHLDATPRAVTAVYRGSMAHIGEAWQALAAHVQQVGLEFRGPSREVYLHTDPEDPEAWVTELQQPVS